MHSTYDLQIASPGNRRLGVASLFCGHSKRRPNPLTCSGQVAGRRSARGAQTASNSGFTTVNLPTHHSFWRLTS